MSISSDISVAWSNITSKPTTITGLQTALDNKVNTSIIGQANGVATLDSSGLVPTTQLPAYVDDVLEYANLAAFPGTGESGKIYVAIDTNKTYRWSGSAYIFITSGVVDSVNGQTGVVNITNITGNAVTASMLQTARTLTIGNMSKTFDGSSNVSWSVSEIGAQASDADLTAIAGLASTSGLLRKTAANTWSLDTNTYVTSSGVTAVTGIAPIVSSGGITPVISINEATTSLPGSMSASDKTKLDGLSNYNLSAATSTSMGGIELFSDTVQSVASNAVSTTASRTYGIQLNSVGQAVVNVPWVDTNTVYTHPTTDGSLHVPATSTTNNGKVLMAGATAGSISWQTIPSGVTDHTLLTNVGTNTHTQIDTAMTRLANTSGTNTGDQTITLTGDITGSGTGSFATVLSNTGVSAGTYKSVTVDLKGRITSGTNPTTISGFGISDAYTKTEIDLVVGDINSALDTINGQVI